MLGALLTIPLFSSGLRNGAGELLLWSGVFLVFTLVASPEPRQIDPVREPVQLSWGTLVFLAGLIAVARVFLADGLLVNL